MQGRTAVHRIAAGSAQFRAGVCPPDAHCRQSFHVLLQLRAFAKRASPRRRTGVAARQHVREEGKTKQTIYLEIGLELQVSHCSRVVRTLQEQRATIQEVTAVVALSDRNASEHPSSTGAHLSRRMHLFGRCAQSKRGLEDVRHPCSIANRTNAKSYCGGA